MSTKDNAATAKHSHIHLPTTRNVRDWLKKPLAREIEIEAAITALCSLLLGWTFFSLIHAYHSYHVVL